MSVITLFTLSSTYTVRFLPPGVEHEQAFREVVFFLNKRLDVVLGQESRVPEVKSKKALVLIILVIVFKHKFKI